MPSAGSLHTICMSSAAPLKAARVPTLVGQHDMHRSCSSVQLCSDGSAVYDTSYAAQQAGIGIKSARPSGRLPTADFGYETRIVAMFWTLTPERMVACSGVREAVAAAMQRCARIDNAAAFAQLLAAAMEAHLPQSERHRCK